jgi:hypothetical protein
MVAGFVCAPPLGIGKLCIQFECRHCSLRLQNSENLVNDRIGPALPGRLGMAFNFSATDLMKALSPTKSL